jgi:small conductance mechanosensitive channel
MPKMRVVTRAQSLFKKYFKTTQITVAITSILLLVTGTVTFGEAEETVATLPSADIGSQTLNEASGFFGSLITSFTNFLPKIAVALIVIAVGWILNYVLKRFIRARVKNWHHGDAISALVGMAIFLLTLGGVISALAGDVRALLGSMGLVGLALSWGLQAPIESFSGWLLNSFRGYYKIGDRIQVGEVFGDVFVIDILTTTVWQAGGPNQSVQAAQPTGALITFPNSEVLRANIINFTSDFPFVWDEISVGISNDSDLKYAVDVIQNVANTYIGENMLEPVKVYRSLLQARNLPYDISEKPSVYAYPTDSWTQIVVRYLVKARERRAASTGMYLAVSEEISKVRHKGKILGGYPRTQVEQIPSRD